VRVRSGGGDELSFFEALGQVTPILAGAEVLGLVHGASRAGLLDVLRDGASLPQLVNASGLSITRVGDICTALEAHGIVRKVGQVYELHPTWRALTDTSSFMTLDALLAMSATRSRLLHEIGSGGDDFWAAPGDRLAYAKGVSPDPMSLGAVQAVQRSFDATPAVRDHLRSASSYLELGSGVAGHVCCLLQIFPNLSATAVELSEELCQEARRRAAALGIADRLEVICGDVLELDRPAAFDVAFWSQMFFPQGTRSQALDVARRSLRTGGMVLAPVIPAIAAPTEGEDASDEAREEALDRVIHGAWGVPLLDPAGVAAEFTEAGFTDVRVVDRYSSLLVIGRRHDAIA
jgi:SAM-dependent methyltransferase